MAAELIGVADAAIRAAADYAKVRVAFGKPIGSYQGVSHPLADSLAQLEGVRSLLYLTACHLDADTTDAAMLSLAVKARAGEIAVEATARALHTFGGVGFTWEHPIHRFHRRAIAANAMAGSSFELGHQLGHEALAALASDVSERAGAGAPGGSDTFQKVWAT
jgi:alkylation response protein AidB-like acyl-CoA dehydrogenase